MRTSPLYWWGLLLASYLGVAMITAPVAAQSYRTVALGLGLPDFAFLSIRHGNDRIQAAVAAGTARVGADYTFSTSVELYAYLFGRSAFDDRKPYYLRTGGVWLVDNTDWMLDQYVYASARFGREFRLSQHWGAQADLGLLYQLYHRKWRYGEPQYWTVEVEYPVLPALGVALFYNFGSK